MTLPSDRDAPIRALLIEDNPGDARLIREMLRDAHGGRQVRIDHVARLADGLAHLRTEQDDAPDVVLLDLSLPDSHGLDTFRRVREQAAVVPIVVLTGSDDEQMALHAVQAGAQDYLVKGAIDGDTLVRAIRYAIERQRLEAARRDLERQRDEFFSNVSHDLRTPVAAIKASVSVLDLTPEIQAAPERVRRLVTNIGLATDELSRLVSDLLELSRLQVGRIELWRADVDLRALVRRTAEAMQPLFDGRGQHLSLDLPAEPLVAAVDAERVGRVLQNLLANANKYAHEGGQVRVRLQTDEGGPLLSVSDDGPGIPLAEQARIFDRFYRVENESARRQVGSGLGLPIARGLVELHGGRLWVTSAPGRGATFYAWLPWQAPQETIT